MKKRLKSATVLSIRNVASAIVAFAVLIVFAAPNGLAQINIPGGGFTSATVCSSSNSIPSSCQVATNYNVVTTPGGALRLTTNATNQAGSAWFVNPLPLATGFQTSFQFLITNPTPTPADGVAFVIQNSPAGLEAIGFTGGNGGAVGYGDDDANSQPTSGIPNSLAIEFDTFQNGWDPDGNHVAVQSCGAGYNTSHHQQLCAPSGPNSTLGIAPATTLGSDILSNGQVHTVSIQYVPPNSSCAPRCNNLTITLDSVSVLTVSVDLATLGLSNGNAYVGFTAATGGNDEDQDLLSWTFNTQIGQPITPETLNQQFIFNDATDQLVQFGFNYTTAYTNNDLTIVNNTVPTVSNQGITQAAYAAMVAGTSLATTQCFIANGEGTDAKKDPLCSQLTLECTNTESTTSAGDNCPQSIQRNLFWTQIVDAPGTGGLNIPSGTAPTLAMGSDNWAPGSCTLVGPEAGKLCPQSTLTQFELLATDTRPGGGGTGTTSNSSFVLGCCEPEWNTVPTVALWANNTIVPVSFTTSPPTNMLANSTNQWVPAPNQSITWGEENLGAAPDTTFPVAGDQTATNPAACPSAWPAWSGTTPPPAPPSFTAAGTVSVSGEGRYEVHYFSTACEDHEELWFPTSLTTANPNNVARFKTAPFNVDTTKPTVSISLNSAVGVYAQNSSPAPTATVTCTDPSSPTVSGLYSGIAKCGLQSSPQLFTGNLQTVSSTPSLSTSTLGTNTLTAIAVDAAGNDSTTSVTYQVVGPDNLSIGMVGAPEVKTGTNLAYYIFVANSGPNAGSLVTVTDTLPAGTSFVSSGYAIDSCTLSAGQPQCSIAPPTKSCGSVPGMCNIGTLPAWTSKSPTGAVVQITVKVNASANTVLKNTAKVSGANSDSDTRYTTATWSTLVTK